MNVNQNINKLLLALSIIGKFYKINTFQFYSNKTCKYCTKYQVLKKDFIKHYDDEIEKFEIQEKYVPDYDCYNKIDLMKYLAEEYRKGSEDNGS